MPEIKAIRIGDKDYAICSSNEDEYKKIFNQWFPGEELTPTSLKEAPRRIIHEVLESVVTQEIEFCLKDIYRGQSGNGQFVIGEKTLLRLNLIKGHIDNTIVKFSLSRDNIFSNLKKVLNYISPKAVQEVGQYFLIPGYGISNLFLLDMKKHQDEEYKLAHEKLMSKFDELKERDAAGDTLGDTSDASLYSLRDEWKKYWDKVGHPENIYIVEKAIEEDHRKYMEELLGDWRKPR